MSGAPRLDRRSALRAGTGLLAGGLTVASAGAASLLAGCAPSGGGLEMAVGWGGTELDLFRRTLREVRRHHRRQVQVTPVGNAIDSFLRTRHRADNLPDVAVVPRPGLVREYIDLGWLQPLDDSLARRFPPAWNDWIRVDGRIYGVWLRAAHKSRFWYLPSRFTREIPATWPELVELVGELARQGRTPLAVGAADGWVLTDWFENLLAARADRELYDDLAAGLPRWDTPVVRDALADLAEIWGIRGAFPGGGRRALLTQFDQSVVQVTATGEALLLYEGDFVRSLAAPFLDRPGDGELRSFPFPSPTGRSPLVVGGDAAVVTRGSEAGAELVDWLTGDIDAFGVWRRAGGYMTPHLGIRPDQYRDEEWELVSDIRDPEPGTELLFDLSDMLPGEMNGAEGVGSWQVLQDFFARVTGTDRDVGDAIDRAVRSLDRMARRVTAAAEQRRRE